MQMNANLTRLLVVTAFLVLAFGSGRALAQDFQSYLTDGNDELDLEHYQQAIASFNAAIKAAEDAEYTTEGPTATENLAKAQEGLGRAHFKLREFDEATKAFNDAIVNDKQLASAYNGLGQVLLEQGRVADAELQFKEAVSREPGNLEYMLNHGLAMAKIGLAEPARRLLAQVLEKQPENAKAYDGRGLAYHGLGEYEKAQADFARAIQLSPDDKSYHFDSGVAYMADEKYPEALQAFANALAIDQRLRDAAEQDENAVKEPPYVDPYIARASIYQQIATESDANRTASLEAAIAECDLGLEKLSQPTQATPRLLLNRAIAERLLGRYNDAITTYTKLIDLLPEDSDLLSEIYLRRGIVLFYRDEFDMAMRDFDDAAQLDPEQDDVRPHMWQGYTHAKQEDYREALVSYNDARSLNPRYAPAYTSMGLAYLKLGELERAIDQFNEALRVDPNDAHTYYKRGATYLALGDAAKAINSLKSAIRIDPEYVEAYRKAAEAYDQLGQNDQAAELRGQADRVAQEIKTRKENPPPKEKKPQAKVGPADGALKGTPADQTPTGESTETAPETTSESTKPGPVPSNEKPPAAGQPIGPPSPQSDTTTLPDGGPSEESPPEEPSKLPPDDELFGPS